MKKENIKKEINPEYLKEGKKAMWPFSNAGAQKGISIVLLIGGISLLFFPMIQISNSFMVGVILTAIGAIYLLDLQ